MKIMHIIDSGGLYGAEVMLLELMTGQKKAGLHPLLCSIGTIGQDDKEIERQARSRGLMVSSVRFRAGPNPYCIANIFKLAQDNQIDILHSHGYKANIFAGIIPRSIRKIPLICTLHGWTNTRSVSKLALYEWLDRRMLAYKDAVVVVNRLMVEDPRLQSANINQKRLFIVNNGIDIHPCKPASQLNTSRPDLYNFTRDGFIVGAIGRLSAEKGFKYLLEAIELLHKDGHKIKLVLAGDGPLREELQHMTVSLGIDKIVLFTGYLANASQYLDYFDVLTISSLSEGLPITLLEAMRANVPVISTRVGGIPDVIEDGTSGILVNPRSPTELGAAIKQMSINPDIRKSMSDKSLSKFREQYTSDTMTRNYLDIYKILQ